MDDFEWEREVGDDQILRKRFHSEATKVLKETARLLGLRIGSWKVESVMRAGGVGFVHLGHPSTIVHVTQSRDGPDLSVTIVPCRDRVPCGDEIRAPISMMRDPSRLADAIASVVPDIVRPVVPPDAAFWETKENWQRTSSMAYSLEFVGWHRGEPILQNRVVVLVSGDDVPKKDIDDVVDAIVSLMEAYPDGDGTSLTEVLERAGISDKVAEWTRSGNTLYALAESGMRRGIPVLSNLLSIAVTPGSGCTEVEASAYADHIEAACTLAPSPVPGP